VIHTTVRVFPQASRRLMVAKRVAIEFPPKAQITRGPSSRLWGRSNATALLRKPLNGEGAELCVLIADFARFLELV
jgi:hypothetical protein